MLCPRPLQTQPFCLAPTRAVEQLAGVWRGIRCKNRQIVGLFVCPGVAGQHVADTAGFAISASCASTTTVYGLGTA